MASNSANLEDTGKHDVAQTALEDDEEKTKSDSSATENFSRREGTSGMGGQLCEIELLMHFLLDGITKKEKGDIDSFYLATNMADASEFDDVVYKYDYTENGKPKTKIIFLQAKHKEKDTAITNDTLLSQSDTGDFALRKYISSFWKISQQFQIKKSPVYTNELEDCELIMYTNANFKTGNNNNIVKKITGAENDVLNFDQETNFYYVLNAENQQFFIDFLKDSNDFKNLITALAESVSKDDKQKCIDINKLIFKDFQHSLTTQILEKHKLGECKLRASFLEDKSEFAATFLTKLTSILYKDRRYFRNPIENLGNTIIKVNDKYWKDEEYPLKLSLPPRQFEDDFISKFIERLKIYTDQPNEKQLTQKIKLKIGNSFPELHKQDIDSVYSDVHVMITNWWKEGNHFLTESNRFFHDSMRVSIRFEVKEPAVPFIGRRTQLDDLHKELNEKGEILISQIATVTGLGGIGKTELARQYVKEHSKEYGDNILWINAENYSSLVESFRKLADRLRISTKDAKNKEKDIKQIVLEVYKYFSDRQRRCLFIFDNAARYRSVNETDEGIDKFLPSGRNKPHVLITSRNQEWGGTIAKIKLNVFTEEEALEFILVRLKDFPPDESHMKDLAKKLQYLPLALNQAVAYIKTENENLRITQKEFTIKDYLKNYDEVGEQVLDLEIDGYTGSVFKTWSITMNKIKKKHFGPKAEEIMNILAYVSPDNVPVKGLFKNVIEEEETLIDTAQLLGQYSMVTLESGNFNIHRVVQDVIRIKLRKKNKEEEVLTRCLGILWMELGQLDNKTGGPFTTHAVKAWEHATKHEEIVKSFSKMPAQIVDRLEESTRYEEAYLFGMDSWNLLERILGSENGDYLPIMNTIGTVHAKCGRYEQALNVYKEWGEKTYDILGPDHPDTLMAEANTSVVLDHLGRYQEALERLEKTLEAREEKFGKNAYDTLITKFNIAAVYQKLGMFPESLQIYHQILPELLIKFGPENEDVLMVKNGIAIALKSLGEYEEALKYYNEVLPVRKKLLGEDHPDTLLTLHGIGVVYEHQELFDEALKVYEEVLDKRRKKFSDDYHPDVLGTENNIAGVLLDKGEYQKGLEMFQKVYEKRLERLGEMHPDTIMTLHNIGLAYEYLKNDDMALVVYQDCYEKRKEVLGENHIETLKTECNLAGIYTAKSNYERALSIYRKVLPKFERRLGHDHPDTKKIRDLIKRVSTVQSLADIYRDFDVYMLQIALMLNDFNKVDRYLKNYKDQIRSNNLYKIQIEGVIDQALTKLMQHEENSDVLIIIALLRTAIDDSLEDDLHRAINTGNIPVIKYLIESGADVNAEVNLMTPLLWAIQNRNEAIVRLLLDHNADPTISNSEGKEPVQHARDLLNANPENENLQTITALLMSLTV